MTTSKTCFTLDFNYYYITVIREVTCQLAAFLNQEPRCLVSFQGVMRLRPSDQCLSSRSHTRTG